MITYNPLTIFRLKDEMGSSNPDKIISGVPFDAEFDSISQSFALAAPSLNASFTGTTTVETANITTANITTATFTTATATTANVTTLVTGSETMVEADYTGFKAASVAVEAKEAGWDATKATVDADSAGWDATKATVDAGNANWDTAYGWGNHAEAGYISSFTNTEYTAGAGLDLSGTVFSHEDTSSVADLTASGSDVMTGMTYDTYGHAQSHTTGTLTAGSNIVINGLEVSTSSSLSATVLVLGNGWFVEENNGTLRFRFLASNSGATFETKMELSSAGDLKVAGNVTAYATL